MADVISDRAVFRTPVSIAKGLDPISHNDTIMMIGSCFTDNVGARLVRDGFNVSVNPMGALYNPASMAGCVGRALDGYNYTIKDLVRDDSGIWHCLDFESRRCNADPEVLLEGLNADFSAFATKLREARLWIVTFGTSWIFERADGHGVVGNCHKFKADFFTRRRLSVQEIVSAWEPLTRGRRVIFTVSPVRHLADGLHGNQLSKSTLLLAVEQLGEYFPAYEALMDDLRDYRFYAADMKHPSEVAVDYIYSLFSDTYFSKETRKLAENNRRLFLRANHRQIL